jgi:Acetyltransferase (GNAT) domain
MQASWRTDADKLTFIACRPLPLLPSVSTPPPDPAAALITAGTADAPACLLGDINLFLTAAPGRVTLYGELELMIAPTAHRRRGHGRSALLAFLLYLERHVRDLAAEYHVAASDSCPHAPDLTTMPTLRIRVKIGAGNSQSLALFRAVGFVPLDGGAQNYFGEVEMEFPFLIGEGKVTEAWAEGIFVAADSGAGARTGTLGYREVVYQRAEPKM